MNNRTPHMVKRAFGEYPLHDATINDGPIQFKTTREDWKLGIKDDPNNCAYARALKRSLAPLLAKMGKLAQKGVAIYKQIAYVPSVEHGKIVILRYRLTSDVHARWDKGVDPKTPEMSVKAVPPTVSQQVETKRLYARAYRKMIRTPGYKMKHRKITPKPGAVLFHVRGNLYNHHSCIAQ